MHWAIHRFETFLANKGVETEEFFDLKGYAIQLW